MTLASTVMSSVPPTLSKLFSWSTRSILAWVRRLMSPISSKKMVPLSARSNFPFFWDTALVNAPFSWPNSSLSMSSSGIAAQFTSMKGFPDLFERRGMFLATSSSPAPRAAPAGQPDSEGCGVGPFCPEPLQPLLAAPGGDDLVPLVLQDADEGFPYVLLVVDDHHGGLHMVKAFTGISITKRVPLGWLSLTLM